MSDDHKQENFSGFGLAIRTFWLTAEAFEATRCWSSEEEKTRLFLIGSAYSEDKVSIIDSDAPTQNFSITINDEDAAKRWDLLKEMGVFSDPPKDPTPEQKLNNRIGELLNENPPTATLLKTESDWEIGTKEGWFIECSLSKETFNQLANDLFAKNITQIKFGIEWVGGVVRDEHAPPSYPTVWGLFSINEGRSPEPLRGHVKSISWSLSASQEVQGKSDDDQAIEAERKKMVLSAMNDEDGKENHYAYGQLGYLFEEATKAAKEVATSKNLSPDDFRWGIGGAAIELVSNIKYALLEVDDIDLSVDKEPTESERKKERIVWQHERMPQRLVNENRTPKFDRSAIEGVVSSYLDMPWRCSAIDKQLTDILVGMEAYQYADEIINEYVVPGLPARSPLKWKHPFLEYIQGSLIYLLILSVPIAALIYAKSQDWISGGWQIGVGAVLSAIIFILLIIMTVSLPSLWKKHNRARKHTVELMANMFGVYQKLEGNGPFSSRHIRKSMEADELKEAVWPAPLFALLDDIDQRNGRF